MDKNVYEFISTKTNDPIVEWKTCTISGTPFPIYQSDLDFYEKFSPTFDGKKFAMPTPTLCPEERQRRRFSWRNEWKLYRRTCDKTGASIVAIYPADSEYPVYDRKVRFSDEWDAMDYGREYDFNKTFFDNFESLNKVVPKKGLHTVDSMENCHYCNYGVFSKDCYMCMGAAWSENCLYGRVPVKSAYDVEGFFNAGCQQTYQCVYGIGCFECAHADHCNNCKFSRFMSFCNNCDYCLGCVNLQTAKYCILNKQYSKEEYEKMSQEILKDRKSIADFQNKFEGLKSTSEKENVNNVNAEDCFGNYIQHSKNCILSHSNISGANSKYSMGGGYGLGPIYDGYAFTEATFAMEISGFTGTKSAFILTGEYGTNDCFYCQHVNDCQNCFGCLGLKHKKYCILNKQYTKDEYERIVAQIISQMQRDKERGEFFPTKNSTFGYNETIAQIYHPMTREAALSRGYKRQDQEHFANIPEGANQIQGKDLPLTIQEISDDILQKVIICEETGKPFRIIQQELDFYRKHSIPIPTRHPDVRLRDVLAKRMPTDLNLIHCAHCQQEVLSAYSADSGYNVRCEKCYIQKFYG